MALNIAASFPTQTTAPTPAYPYGSAQNITVSGDNTGTPFNKTTYDDILGFQQALLDAAGITPSGIPDQVGASQYLDALNALVAAAGASTQMSIGSDASTVVSYDSTNHNNYNTLTNAAPITVQMEIPTAPFGDIVNIEKGAGSGDITIQGAGGVTIETISGGSNVMITDGQVGTLVSKSLSVWKLIV